MPKHYWNLISFFSGLWLIISPWLLGFSGQDVALWNSIFMGLIISLASLWLWFGENK